MFQIGGWYGATDANEIMQELKNGPVAFGNKKMQLKILHQNKIHELQKNSNSSNFVFFGIVFLDSLIFKALNQMMNSCITPAAFSNLLKKVIKLQLSKLKNIKISIFDET